LSLNCATRTGILFRKSCHLKKNNERVTGNARAHYRIDTMLREMVPTANQDQAPTPIVAPGPLFSFVPSSEPSGAEVLVERLIAAGAGGVLKCADPHTLTDQAAAELLSQSNAIFLVVTADQRNLFEAHRKMCWIREQGCADRTGIIVHRAGSGLSAVEIEDRLGAPVCSVIDERDDDELLRFAYEIAIYAAAIAA
jgi:hypothetical protein